MSAAGATLGASMVDGAAMRSCMLSVDLNLPSIKDQDFVGEVLDERARLFTKAEDLKVLPMSRVKEKIG